jgi:hypothetical protein
MSFDIGKKTKDRLTLEEMVAIGADVRALLNALDTTNPINTPQNLQANAAVWLDTIRDALVKTIRGIEILIERLNE